MLEAANLKINRPERASVLQVIVQQSRLVGCEECSYDEKQKHHRQPRCILMIAIIKRHSEAKYRVHSPIQSCSSYQAVCVRYHVVLVCVRYFVVPWVCVNLLVFVGNVCNVMNAYVAVHKSGTTIANGSTFLCSDRISCHNQDILGMDGWFLEITHSSSARE